MPRRYPVEFRRKVLDLIEAGKPAAEMSDWRKQDRVDQGLEPGTSPRESAETSC